MDEGRLFRIELLGEQGDQELQRRQAHLEHLQNLRQSVLLEGGKPSDELQAGIERAETRVNVYQLARKEIREHYGELTPEDFDALQREIEEAQREKEWEANQEQRELEAGQEWVEEQLSEPPKKRVSNMDEKSLEDPSTMGWIFPVPRQKCNMIYGVKKPTVKGFEPIEPSSTRQVDNIVVGRSKRRRKDGFNRRLFQAMTSLVMEPKDPPRNSRGKRVKHPKYGKHCSCLNLDPKYPAGGMCSTFGEDDIVKELDNAIPMSHINGVWAIHFLRAREKLVEMQGRHESSCPAEGTPLCLYCMAEVPGMLPKPEQVALEMFLKLQAQNPTFPMLDFVESEWETIDGYEDESPEPLWPKVVGWFSFHCALRLLLMKKTEPGGPIDIGFRYGHIVKLPHPGRILPTMLGAAVVEVLEPEDCPIITKEEARSKLLDEISLRRNPDIVLPGDDLPFVWQRVRDEQTCYRIATKNPRGKQLPIDWNDYTSGVADRKDWEPSIAEMRGWEQVMPFPPAATEHFQTQEDAFLAVGKYMQDNFAYVCHDELGRLFRECADELPLITSTLKWGHCDALSWTAAAYMRQLGLPAVVVEEYVYAGQKEAYSKEYAGTAVQVGTFKKAHTHAKVLFLANDGNIRAFDPTYVVPRPRSHYTDRLPAAEVAGMIASFKRKRKLETKRRVLENFAKRYPVNRLRGMTEFGYRERQHRENTDSFVNHAKTCGPYMAQPHEVGPWDRDDVMLQMNRLHTVDGYSGDGYLLKKLYNPHAWGYGLDQYETRHKLYRLHEFVQNNGILLQGSWVNHAMNIEDRFDASYKLDALLQGQNQYLLPEGTPFLEGFRETAKRIFFDYSGLKPKIVAQVLITLLFDEKGTASLQLVDSVDVLLREGFTRRLRDIIFDIQNNEYFARRAYIRRMVSLKRSISIRRMLLAAAMFPRLIALGARDSRLRRRLEAFFQMKPGQYRGWVEKLSGFKLNDKHKITSHRPEFDFEKIGFFRSGRSPSIHHYRKMFAPDMRSNARAAGRLLQAAMATQRRRLPEDIEWKEYTPGDDVRLVDWKVTERVDKLIVRKPRMGMEPDSPLYVHIHLFNGDIPTVYLRFHAVVEILRQLKKQSNQRKIFISFHDDTSKAYVRLKSHHDPFKFAEKLLFGIPKLKAYDKEYLGFGTKQGMPNIIYITEHDNLAANMQYLLQGPRNRVVATTFQDAGFVYDSIRPEWLEFGFSPAKSLPKKARPFKRNHQFERMAHETANKLLTRYDLTEEQKAEITSIISDSMHEAAALGSRLTTENALELIDDMHIKLLKVLASRPLVEKKTPRRRRRNPMSFRSGWRWGYVGPFRRKKRIRRRNPKQRNPMSFRSGWRWGYVGPF